MSVYDNLFKKADKPCYGCGKDGLNWLNGMLVCEACGWYFITGEAKAIIQQKIIPAKKKKRKALIKDRRRPMSEFMLNAS